MEVRGSAMRMRKARRRWEMGKEKNPVVDAFYRFSSSEYSLVLSRFCHWDRQCLQREKQMNANSSRNKDTRRGFESYASLESILRVFVPYIRSAVMENTFNSVSHLIIINEFKARWHV